jgi:ribosome-associated protein
VQASAGRRLKWEHKGDHHLTDMNQSEEGATMPAPPPPALRTANAGTALTTALTSLDDAKAEGTVTIDIAGKSALGDHMVVTSGRSHRHVNAIADRLVTDLKQAGMGPLRVEGLPHCDWVLVDAGDLIIHIFRPEVREFYNIEKMWTAEPAVERRVQA